MRGFSLLEVLIVVALIGILAAVALPSYQSYIIKGKRAAAKAVLADLANRQQAYLLDKRAYADPLTALIPSFAPPSEIASDYAFTASANNTVSPPTFNVRATPTSPQMLRDSCGTSASVPLELTQNGTRSPTGCW